MDAMCDEMLCCIRWRTLYMLVTNNGLWEQIRFYVQDTVEISRKDGGGMRFFMGKLHVKWADM